MNSQPYRDLDQSATAKSKRSSDKPRSRAGKKKRKTVVKLLAEVAVGQGRTFDDLDADGMHIEAYTLRTGEDGQVR